MLNVAAANYAHKKRLNVPSEIFRDIFQDKENKNLLINKTATFKYFLPQVVNRELKFYRYNLKHSTLYYV